MAHVRTRKESRRRGAVAAEAAVVIPLLLVVTFGAIKYGWLSLQAQYITNAARHGARMVVLPDVGIDAAKTSMISLLAIRGIPVTESDIEITSHSMSDDPESPLYGRMAYMVYIEVPADREQVDILLNFPWLPDWKRIKARVIMAEEGQ